MSARRDRRAGTGGRRSRGLALLLAATTACSVVQERVFDSPPAGRPSGQRGMLQYGIGRLTFLAPDTWEASGSSRKLHLAHPQDRGVLDVQQSDRSFRDEKECLANAEESLAKGSAKLTNIRRHASSFAGKRAIAQEADQGAWHGWAWALCDGGTQYRLWFAGVSPVQKDVLDAWHALTKSAAFSAAGSS
jgi:hypothetical protein